MAITKEFVTVRVDVDIYDDVKQEVEAAKPKPTITHEINTLLAEAIAARKLKREEAKA